MNFIPYPLLFDPSFSKRVWGGKKIATILKRTPTKKNDQIAESLEIFDREKHSSKVSNGVYAGQSLNNLIKKFSKELVSNQHKPDSPFPIIIKYLNPNTPTSVQVHPDNNFILKNGGQAKSEFWYILEADSSAKAYIGLKNNTSKENLLKSANTEKILDYLRDFKLKKEDSYNILPGQIHCLTGESLALEIQNNSECTYRFFDWNRKRDTHVNKALEATDFISRKSSLIPANANYPDNRNFCTNLTSLCPNFIVNKLSLINDYHHSTSKSAEILIPLTNDIKLTHTGKPYKIPQYSPVLLPHSLGAYSIIPNQKTQLISIKLK